MKRAVLSPTLGVVLEDSDQMIGRCKAMQEVYKMIGQVAESDVTVLIRGESGRGKNSSPGPFISTVEERAARS
jgi:DNA-binding NtrC family response regulator